MRLIDADALEKEWCSGCQYEKNKYANCDDCALAHAPTVEPERKKGEWVDMSDFEQCSVCRGTHLKEFQSYYGKTIWVKSNFCPYCGADMRGEQDDTD